MFSINVAEAAVGLDKSAYFNRIKLVAWLWRKLLNTLAIAFGDVPLSEGCNSVQMSRK